LISTVTIVGMIFASGFAIFLIPALFVMVERISQRRLAKAGSAGLASIAPEDISRDTPEHAASGRPR
jgi:hypothetical protein